MDAYASQYGSIDDALQAKYVEERAAIANGDEQAIAELNEKIIELSNQMIMKEIDTDGLSLNHAELVKGCIEENGHLYDRDGNQLDRDGLVDDEYYCFQMQGFIEDDFYGTLYYATDEQGTFVKVPFNTY